MKFLLQFCCINLIAATRAEGGLVSVLIHVCVNQQKLQQLSLTAINCVRIFLMVFSVKKIRETRKMFLWGGFIFSDLLYAWVTKKMTAAFSDLFWGCTNFFNRHGTFFRIILGGTKIGHKILEIVILVDFHHDLSYTNKYWSEVW